MEGDRIVKIDDKEYVLRKFGIGEKIAIRDSSLDAMGNVKLGTFQLKTLAASLVSWNYQDGNNNLVPPNEKNIVKFLNPDHFDQLVAAAVEVNNMTVAEKKRLFVEPAKPSAGQSESTSGSGAGELSVSAEK